MKPKSQQTDLLALVAEYQASDAAKQDIISAQSAEARVLRQRVAVLESAIDNFCAGRVTTTSEVPECNGRIYKLNEMFKIFRIEQIEAVAAEIAGQSGSEPYGWLYDWTHSSATGKPDEHITSFTTDRHHAEAKAKGWNRNVRAVFLAPQPSEPACRRCGDIGTIMRLSDNSPDAEDIEVECPDCDALHGSSIPASCQGRNCGATDGQAHSSECVIDAAEAQGWSDSPEAIAAQQDAGKVDLQPTDSEIMSVMLRWGSDGGDAGGIAELRALFSKPDPALAGDDLNLIEQLREYAANNGYSHSDYADTMREAANALERVQPASGEDVRDVARYRGLRAAAMADDHTFLDAAENYADNHFTDRMHPTQAEFDASLDAGIAAMQQGGQHGDVA